MSVSTRNIAWFSGDPALRDLSNFGPTPFELDGLWYGTAESFWQCLKYPDGSVERARVAAIGDGVRAKAAGRAAPAGGRTFQYGSRRYTVGSPAHHALFARALRAKFAAHPHLRALLISTGTETLTHVVRAASGRTVADSPGLPSAVFCGLLTDLRAELLAGALAPVSALPDPDLRPAAPAPAPQLSLF